MRGLGSDSPQLPGRASSPGTTSEGTGRAEHPRGRVRPSELDFGFHKISKQLTPFLNLFPSKVCVCGGGAGLEGEESGPVIVHLNWSGMYMAWWPGGLVLP